MRRKIQALIVWTGMPAVWITINPNDINNPVKMRLSIHRLHDYDKAKDLLSDLQGRYERIALSTMDPVSAAIFFHREISLFFDKFVRTGQESVFGKGADKPRRTACRFKAPWKIVDETGFVEDGLLRIRRNHPLVNRYNKSLAVGLRHNHDISMILTRTKGLAMVFYITNYATKLDTPMWKRIALAADVVRQLRESAALRHQVSDHAAHDGRRQAVLNESRQFLMRTANRIFSERQLSAVELRRPHEYAVPIFQGFISDDHEDEHPVYIKRRSAEDARKDAKLWASRSEGDDTVDVEFPLHEGDNGEEPATMAKCHQNYTALLQVLQNAVRDSHATRDSHVLRDLIRDLCQENPLEEGRPLVQRHEGIYEQIRRNQDSPLRQYPTLSGEDVQAAAKAQGMLHLQQLDEIESGFQGVTLPPRSADVDDMLVSHCDVEISFPGHGQDVVAQGPRMFLDINPATGFVEMGHIAATSYTLNYLQTMALQLVCGTGKSRIVDALRDIFAARGQPHLLQVTGTSGSAAARIGGTTIHSACGLWHMFKTVVLLEEQVRTRDDPQLGALLDRVRAGMQTQQDLVLLNTKLLDRSQITFHSGLRAITPLNRNRWSLNMEAVVDWARFNKRHISVFISATRPTPGEVARCLES
ncbi:PIF1 protein [Hirsutella rhossiliensis]